MTIPILFLHGWTMRGSVFDIIAGRLGTDFTCHAPDLPGHGDHVAGDPSLDACASLIGQWTEQLEQPILVGWSMGATAAWRYIAQNGTAGLRGLITIDMSPRILPDKTWSLGMNGQSAEAIKATSDRLEADWPRVAHNISRNLYAEGSNPTLDRDMIKAELSKQNPALLRKVWDDLVAADERATIAKIDIPYLVCFGIKSQLYRAEVAQWIAKQAPNAQLAPFTQSGHSPHLEEPDQFCNAIRCFVADHRLEPS